MSTTEQSAVPAARAKALAQPREGGAFLRSFNNSLVTILVVVIAVLWSIPTFGLFTQFVSPAPGNRCIRLVDGAASSLAIYHSELRECYPGKWTGPGIHQ